MRMMAASLLVGISCLQGCGEPAPPSLPITVIPKGYAIVSADWNQPKVPVCDLLVLSKTAEDIKLRVEVARPEKGTIYRGDVNLPGKGRVYVTGHLRSKTLEDLKSSGHIQPGDTVEISKYDCKPLIVPIPAADDLEILYQSPAGGLMAEPTK